MKEIVLASASPRRKQLLEMLGVENLKVQPAKGEEHPPHISDPARIVRSLAESKAREVAAECSEGDLVVAADTIVWLDGELLGKPKSEEDAAAMLRRLSGRKHEVWTGVCVMQDGTADCRAECSEVFFRKLTGEEIQTYIATGEPMDKAGAYGAQGKGALFVRRIEGDFFNVMGLPLCLLGEMLAEKGVRIL